MLEILLLITTSIVIGSLLEKSKYRLAMIAHAVFVAFMFVAFYLASDWWVCVVSAQNVLGPDTYQIVHGAFVDSIDGISIGFSSVMILEIVVYGILIALATVSVLKAYKKVVKYLVAKKQAVRKAVASEIHESSTQLEVVDIQEASPLYLRLCQLRN